MNEEDDGRQAGVASHGDGPRQGGRIVPGPIWRGSGRLPLLVSSVTCEACAGSGRADDPDPECQIVPVAAADVSQRWETTRAYGPEGTLTGWRERFAAEPLGGEAPGCRRVLVPLPAPQQQLRPRPVSPPPERCGRAAGGSCRGISR